MAQPTYKLYYFDIKGRGELSRLLFAAAAVEYEDFRFKLPDWVALKPKMPFKQIPALEVNGKIYAQSTAINRYLASKFGLNGENDEERLEIDQVLGVVLDFVFFVDRSFKETDEERKASYMKEAVEVHGLSCLGYLENLIKKSDTGFFVGSKLSLADLAVFDIMDYMTDRKQDILQDFPSLQCFKEKVGSIERIRQYVEKRKN